VRHVVAHAAAADLELERVVAAFRQEALGFLDIAAVSPLASVQSTGSVSRTAPPSSVASGTSRRLPCASSMADSSADLANRLPRATLFRRAIAACTLVASWPTSAGAR
jgi:hypothetical protein